MTRHTEYGLEWELDPDEKKGQLGLLREDHYRMLFALGQREESLRPKDVWLDIGANIGAFAVRAAPFVREVVAVEPDPENFKCLKRNVELNNVEGQVYCLKAAVVAGPHGQWVPLALSKTFSSTHRLGHIRGRRSIEVSGININVTTAMYDINKIKMDCEGTEAEILENMNFEKIEEIIFEYHFAFLKDHDWSRFLTILTRLKTEGFTILKEPKEWSKTWHTIVWAKRL